MRCVNVMMSHRNAHIYRLILSVNMSVFVLQKPEKKQKYVIRNHCCCGQHYHNVLRFIPEEHM